MKAPYKVIFSNDTTNILDCRLGTDLSDWLQRTLDWSREAVRDHMFALIEEQCENYDIDGFELDFMRFPHFFHPERTTHDDRVVFLDMAMPKED